MKHEKQVLVTINTGKIHEIKEADNWKESWKIVTGCNHTVTNARIMSMSRAKEADYSRCKVCFNVPEVEVIEEGEEVRLKLN